MYARMMLMNCFLIVPLHSLTMKQLIGEKFRRPPTEKNGPLDVRLGMYLESLGNFRSNGMSFDVDLYVYMSWQDPRLRHIETDYVMVNDDSIRKQLWLPDLYFANAREATFQKGLQQQPQHSANKRFAADLLFSEDEWPPRHSFIHWSLPMRLLLIAGDISSIRSAAVVNAANEKLHAGGGVDGAIRNSAGHGITEALKSLYPNGCPTGSAVHTAAFNMKNCEHVFHAVGPRIRAKTVPSRLNEAQLCSAYISVLQQANSMRLDSVAFPILSTGIFNYPMDRGVLAGMYTVLAFMKENYTSTIQTVTLVFGSSENMNLMTKYASNFECTTEADIERELLRLRSFAIDKDAPIILKRNNIVIRSFLRKFEDTSDRKNVCRYFVDCATSDEPIVSVIYGQQTTTSKTDEYRHRERSRLKQKRSDDVNYRLSESQKIAWKRNASSVFYMYSLMSNSERKKKRRTEDAQFRQNENTLRNIRMSEISQSKRKEINLALRVRRSLRCSNHMIYSAHKKNSKLLLGLLSRDICRGNRQRILKNNFNLTSTKTFMKRSIQAAANHIEVPQDNTRLVCQLAANSLLKFRSVTKRQVDHIVRDIKQTVCTGLEVKSKMIRLLEKEQKSLRRALDRPNSNVINKALQIGGARLHVKTHEIEGAEGSYYPHQKYYSQKGMAPGFESVMPASPSTSLESTASSNVNCDGDRHVEYIPRDENVELGRKLDDTSTSLTQPLCELSMGSTTSTAENMEIEQSQPMFTLQNPENIANPTYAKTCDSSCILPDCDWPSAVETAMTTLLTKDIDLLMKSLINIDRCSMCSANDLCPSIERCTNVKRLLLILYSHCRAFSVPSHEWGLKL